MNAYWALTIVLTVAQTPLDRIRVAVELGTGWLVMDTVVMVRNITKFCTVINAVNVTYRYQ